MKKQNFFKNAVIFFLFIVTNLCVAQEYQEYELESVEFIGNNDISASDLESIISSKESPGWFSQFLYSFSSFGEKSVIFDSTLIANDVSAIHSYYWSNGYFKASVSAEYTLDTLNSEAILKFFIIEGPPFKFKAFHKNGLETVPWEFVKEINDQIHIDATVQYSDELIRQEIALTLNSLRDKGYMLIQTEPPFVNVDTVENNVEIVTHFDPGIRYKIREVTVNKTGEGKDLVEDELLKDIVGVKPGSYYDYYALRRGQIRLYRTNLFTSALVTAITADTIGNTVPVSINTDVGLVNELSPEIIVNNEDNTFNLGLGLGYLKKNFLGDARKLTIGASSAAQSITDFLSTASINDTTIYGYADARISVEQPFLFGRPINTKLETYITFQKRKSEYNARIYGTKLSFDFELPQYTFVTSLITYMNWENSKYVFRDEYISRGITSYYYRTLSSNVELNIDSLLQVISKSSISTNAVIGVEIGANKTNNMLFPTRGYTISILLEDGNTIPYLISKIGNAKFNNPRYYKVVLNTTAYLPFYGRKGISAFGIKLKGGYIGTYSGNKYDIPLNQRFYAGGSNSVRGWSTRELVPKNPEIILPENPTSEDIESIFLRGVIPGGFLLFEGSVESRNRLTGLLGSAVFIDFGNTWDNFNNFRLDEVAVAAGFGLRFYFEFAPIRIDFGFRIYDPHDRRNFFSKKTMQETFEFQLGIGEAF